MPRIPRRRPSAAMIVACCALFVALGGTSYAVAVGSIGSPQIRDDSIRGIDVHNRSLTGHDLAPDSVGGGAINEEALDLSKLRPAGPDIAARVKIDLFGRVVSGEGVTNVDHLQTGAYQLDLDRDVSACVPAATIVGPDIPGPGMIGVRTNAGQDRSLFVETTNRAGAAADQSFYLIVLC